jgi:hypothetical protein
MHETLLKSERVTLLDLLDRVLETGVAVDGEIDLSVADINLVHLGLKLVLASSATLEQHSNGGAAHFGDATDEFPCGSPGECSIGSAPCLGPPMLAAAESQSGADLLPPCASETILDSQPVPEQEKSGEWLAPKMDPSDDNHTLPVRAGEETSPKFALGRVPPLPGRRERPDFDPAKIEHGLAKLALTLIELIRRLMERQAARRMECGTLTDIQVERLGEAFRRLDIKMVELKHSFGLDDEELNLDLGPLGALM